VPDSALSKKAARAHTREVVVSIHCDVVIKWGATPPQLTALGTALWRWCSRTAGGAGIYRQLDNQALADLIAGQIPRSSEPSASADRRGAHFPVRDEASLDRQATIDDLRHALPTAGVEDVVVDGASWGRKAKETT
jgi:hypothetical protein